tara:strand:+ start:33278 stop:33580 length:303 start_codon:yes stop_codon:yes gene_type:complete
VTVAVGSTILQEHAFARPDSACIRCSFLEATAADVVPLSITELMMSSATAAAMLAARGKSGARVVVAVAVTVELVNIRVVDVTVVTVAALVVIVLHRVNS